MPIELVFDWAIQDPEARPHSLDFESGARLPRYSLKILDRVGAGLAVISVRTPGHRATRCVTFQGCFLSTQI